MTSFGLAFPLVSFITWPIKPSPPVASASTYSVNPEPRIVSADPPSEDTTPISLIYGLGLIAFFGIIGYKLWKRTKRPSQNRHTDFNHISHTVQNRFLQLRDEDPDLFLHEINAKLKKYSRRGNELYEAKGILPDKKKLKILKYRDPSTDRIYISFVPENFTDPDEAMAWKFNITKQQYQNLVDEG